MIHEFVQYGKKNFIILIIAAVILELGVVFLLRNSLNPLLIVACTISIFIGLFVVVFMLSSLENAFYAFALIFPIMPISGYAALFVNHIKYQFAFYLAFYLLFFISLIKNNILKKLELNIKLNKDNIYLVILGLLVLMNAILAFNKTISFMILILGVIPTLIYFTLVKFTKLSIEKSEFIKNIFLCIFAGVALSGVPDLLKFIYATIANLKLRHIGGPLGSNFLMTYSLLTYPFVIVNYKIEENLQRKKYYKYVLILQTIIICTQRSRGLLVAIVAMFIIFLINIKNVKYYLAILLVIIPCLIFNIYNRVDVSTDIVIVEKGTEGEIVKDNLGNLKVFLKLQSSNREPIWNSAAGIIREKPVIGVGNGNFQFFFNKYAPEKYNKLNITFVDAHNFILNSLAEFGAIFTVLMLLYLTTIVIKSFIKVIKLQKNSKEAMMLLALIGAAAAYFVFGNITGASFQSVRVNDIHSYTPIFIFGFVLFYYNNILKNIRTK